MFWPSDLVKVKSNFATGTKPLQIGWGNVQRLQSRSIKIGSVTTDWCFGRSVDHSYWNDWDQNWRRFLGTNQIAAGSARACYNWWGVGILALCAIQQLACTRTQVNLKTYSQRGAWKVFRISPCIVAALRSCSDCPNTLFLETHLKLHHRFPLLMCLGF